MSFEEEGEKIAKLAFSDMIRELFQENTSLLSIVDPAAKALDEKDLTNTEQLSLEKLYSKIGEKINVPSDARKRIFEICKKRGIPETEILSLQTISEVCPIKKSNQSKIEAVVYIFSLLLVYTLAIFFLNKSNKRFSVNAQSYQVAQIINETDSVKKLLPFKEVTQMASPAMDNLGQLLNASRRQEEVQPSRQTKRSLQKSVAASAKKKIFDSQNPTIIVTEGDKKRFHDISIKETFLSKREPVGQFTV